MPTLELKRVPQQSDGLYQLRVPDHSNMVMPGLSDTIFGEAPTDDPRRTWNYSFNAANIPSLMQSCIDVPQSTDLIQQLFQIRKRPSGQRYIIWLKSQIILATHLI
jgi:hypothetical protein